MGLLLIDNNDSFVFNLAAYFRELGESVSVKNISDFDSEKLDSQMQVKGIVLSPGPGTPEQALVSQEFVQVYAGKIPILGVCLGHQVIAHCFGARVGKGRRPMHGKISRIIHSGTNLFEGISEDCKVTRYHSLVVDPESLPTDFIIDARSDDGDIMAITHVNHPLFGVQFHPEAILTEQGHTFLRNFLLICNGWERSHGIA